MGGVPAKIVQVLAFDSFENGALAGDRYEVGCPELGVLLYSWDSDRRPPGYTSLADTLYLTDTSGKRVARRKFSTPLYPEGDGKTTWMYDPALGPQDEGARVFCAVLFPRGCAGEAFNYAPMGIKPVGDRLAVLFLLSSDPATDRVMLTWRTYKTNEPVRAQMERVRATSGQVCVLLGNQADDEPKVFPADIRPDKLSQILTYLGIVMLVVGAFIGFSALTSFPICLGSALLGCALVLFAWHLMNGATAKSPKEVRDASRGMERVIGLFRSMLSGKAYVPHGRTPEGKTMTSPMRKQPRSDRKRPAMPKSAIADYFLRQ